MEQVILVIQILVSALLIAAVLVQVKGTGFGRAWGDSVSFSKRGLERAVFRGTFVLSFVFVVVSILQLLI